MTTKINHFLTRAPDNKAIRDNEIDYQHFTYCSSNVYEMLFIYALYFSHLRRQSLCPIKKEKVHVRGFYCTTEILLFYVFLIFMHKFLQVTLIPLCLPIPPIRPYILH